MTQYDANNVFYKIINKEIKSNIILEGKHFIAIEDIAPKAPVHVLIIPKGSYVNYTDFLEKASDEEVLEFNKGILEIVKMKKLKKYGYKLLCNTGKFTTMELTEPQSVMHMHVHIMGKSSED